MKPFAYIRVTDTASAVRSVAAYRNAKFLGGGTNLVDLMRENIEAPETLIDISALPIDRIDELVGGGLRIGALARNSDVATHPVVRRDYPVLAQALLSGASAQLRNVATIGGNLLQRTRCLYFYDAAAACNKRVPGSGCDALTGFHRMSAIFGASSQCISVHPSDLCVALAALDAIVELESVGGRRRVPIVDFYRLPGPDPHIETQIRSDELITAVVIPPLAYAANSRYRKVRDRASYAFALVSVAAALDVQGGQIAGARIALGGVAAKPWRARAAEMMLIGGPASAARISAAIEAELASAAPYDQTQFKVELVRRIVISTLTELANEGTTLA